MSFTWKEPKRVPMSAVAAVRDAVLKSGSFAPWSDAANTSRPKEIMLKLGFTPGQAAETVAHLWGYNVTVETMYRHAATERAAKDSSVVALYESQGILAAASKNHLPPLGLFRQIILHRGLSKQVVSGILTYNIPASEHLSERDILQLRDACIADSSCKDNQVASMRAATIAEDQLVDYFTAHGVSLKTQEDLIAENHRTATPDILFETPVSINGREVNWLDNKNYTFIPGGFLAKSAAKQAVRNNREWGVGGFCYRGICGESKELAGAFLFDTLELLPPVPKS
jgi:Protein of unknown function TPD sequence-motif